jgi:hypothetical protein
MSPKEKQHGLGRRKSVDKRDLGYPVKAILRRVDIERKYWWANGAWYDQGATGTCVGHGWAHFGEDSPLTHPGDIVDPYDIYAEAVKLDPWRENDGPPPDYDFGTTVRAGAKAMQKLGYIDEYRWAFDVATMRDTILSMGPMVLGVDWFNSMWETVRKKDAAGTYRQFIEVDTRSGLAGGHCVKSDAVTNIGRCFRIKQSWGRGWGAYGFGYISFEDMEVLLQRGAEACIAREVKRAA